MTETREVLINGKWPLVLPEHRAAREEWATGWEPVRLDSMHANLKPGMVLYDIGTEEGDLSALFAQWVQQRRWFCDFCKCWQSRNPEVWAGACETCLHSGEVRRVEPDGGGVVLVEPNPRVWPNIRCIWEANGLPAPLACVEGFVGDEVRAVPDSWFAPEWPPSADGPIIGDHGFRNVKEHPEQTVVTVDYLSGFVSPPDAVTMDVEGAEWLIAKGMQRTLTDYRPLVWVSVHAEAMFHDWGAYQVEFYSQFHQCGYEKVLLDFDHELHVFFYPSERRGDVVI